MTSGEKMVWAAAFIKRLEYGAQYSDGSEEAERARAANAAEYASGAVERMQEAMADVDAGYGRSSDVAIRLRRMLVES